MDLNYRMKILKFENFVCNNFKGLHIFVTFLLWSCNHPGNHSVFHAPPYTSRMFGNANRGRQSKSEGREYRPANLSPLVRLFCPNVLKLS